MHPTKPQKEGVVSVLHLTMNTKNVINFFHELMNCLLTSFNKERLSQHFKKVAELKPPCPRRFSASDTCVKCYTRCKFICHGSQIREIPWSTDLPVNVCIKSSSEVLIAY